LLAVAHVLGLLLGAAGAAYVLPIACSLIVGDGLAGTFLLAGMICSGTGLLLAGMTIRFRRELKPRDGFLLVTLGWVLVSACAAVPLLMALPKLTFTKAVFEAMSGLTTTGSTILSGLDSLPPSLNFWRHCLHWFGGLGIIVMAVAILPLLGVGGMQMYRAETPGAVKDEKLAPRITSTAKSLSIVYTLITLAGIMGLRLCGMSWLDAICHAFSAVGLGGFSTHDASIGFFNSAAIEFVLMVLMIIASLNFARHFIALRRLSMEPYKGDPESKAILWLLGLSVVGVAVLLWWREVYPTFFVAFRHAAFNVVSMATTTGLVTEDFGKWPVFAPSWMLFLSCILCSTGSTGGGIKMFRTLLLAKQAGREMKLLVHPSAVAPVRIGGRPIPDRVAHSVLGFIFLYFMTVALFTFALLLSGLDFTASVGAIVGSINNTAGGLSALDSGRTYQSLSDVQTWICTAAMLLGRLEVFSVLVLFTPAFWRK
jgi:trk system potassium uptake protein TrkH